MPDDKVVFITRTNHDSATRYIFHWADIIKDEAILLGFKVVELNGEHFEQEKFRKIIEEYDPKYIFVNGHGSQYSVKGNDGKTDVILRCQNNILLKDRIVYTLSCHTAVILGKSSIVKGCNCYIGYNDRVEFLLQDLVNPLTDFVSEPFMQVSNEIPLSLLKGQTPEEAYKNSQKRCDDLITHWKNDTRPEAPYIVKWLKVLKQRQVMLISDSVSC